MAGNSSVALELDDVELTGDDRVGGAGEAIGLVFGAVMRTMERNRIRRLSSAGFDAQTARYLSDLHTPNLM
jgi:hypothetical protein